jgi:hypothetical protein
MISLLWVIAFVALLGMAALILWSLIWWLRRSSAGKRSPLTRNLLRNPGDSLRPQLEDLDLDMMGLWCVLFIAPLVVYSIWITELHFGTARVTTFTVSTYVMLTLVALGFVWYRLLSVMKRRRALLLGLDGEMAIGQELNQLMLRGYASRQAACSLWKPKLAPNPLRVMERRVAKSSMTDPPFASPPGRIEASSSKQLDRQSGYHGGSRAPSASLWRLNPSWRFQAGTLSAFSAALSRSLVDAMRTSWFDQATALFRPRKFNESFTRWKRDVERLSHAGTHGGTLQAPEPARSHPRLPALPEVAQELARAHSRRPIEDQFRRPILDDAAGVEHRDPVTDAMRERHL